MRVSTINLLTFILCSFGLTQILVYGKIFDKIRPKHYLFHCPMCMGFWSSFVIWLISPLTTLFIFDQNLTTGLLLACLGSGSSYVLCQLFDDDGFNIKMK